MELDPRIVQIGIEVNGQTKLYTGLTMTAKGVKYGNANQNECEIVLTNLDKTTSDYILTQTSPFNLNRTPKVITVDAGRVSYGTTRIFSGDVASAVPSQPPDIALTLKCLTGNFQKGNVISTNQAGSAQLSEIAQQVATELKLVLNFQATDKPISNYSFSGGALKQVERLGEMGNVNAFIDNDTLVVKNNNTSLSNQTRILNIDTGLIGIPEITEQGIKATFLLDNQTTLGGGLRIQSQIYPAVNGDYTIYKLSFDIASRDTPFYWIAEATRNGVPPIAKTKKLAKS